MSFKNGQNRKHKKTVKSLKGEGKEKSSILVEETHFELDPEYTLPILDEKVELEEPHRVLSETSGKYTKYTPIKKGKGRTKKMKRRFLELFHITAGNISDTAKKLGISRRVYYNWINEDPEFKEAIEEEREALIDFAETKLFELIKEGNLTAIIFFLKTRAKHRGYVERTEIGSSEESPLRVKMEVIYTDRRPEE